MLTKKTFPHSIFIALAGIFLGVLATAAWMAAFSYWMAEKKMSSTVAEPLALFAICFGAFFSGWLVSTIKKEQGLLNGLFQGCIFVGLLWGGAYWYGVFDHKAVMFRCAVVLLSGICGGISGILLKHSKHHV